MNEETKEVVTTKKTGLHYGLHMVFLLAVAAVVAWFSHVLILETAWNKEYFIFSGAILFVITLLALLERKKIYVSGKNTITLVLCFLVSAMLLLLSDYYVNLPVWLLGGIAAAALANRSMGMLYLYYFVYHAIYLQGDWRNGLVFHFVVATLISVFIPKMKSFLGMLYMMAFTACAVIAGSVIHNRMVIAQDMLLDTFYILCTYLGCIFITMLLVKWTEEKEVAKAEEYVPNNYDYLDLLARETAEQDAAIAEIVKTVKEEAASAKESSGEKEEQTGETPEPVDYSAYCDEKSPLLLELRTKNKSSYAQAILVGKLASETARTIGLNEELTKAGGLYRRIGKIKEGNSDDTSVEIAREHNFPQPLIDLIDQLNHNRIEQKEAALLLITEGVISYYSIVRHVQKKDTPVEKIVDTIVSKKIFQGEFNESGLGMQECYLLREKLIHLLVSQDKKHAAK